MFRITRPFLSPSFAILCSVACTTIPAAAAESASPAESAPRASDDCDIRVFNGITGDWNGLRTQAQASGLSFEGFVQLDISKNFRGGLDTEATPIRYLLDLSATLDTEPSLHWPGGSAFFEFQNHDGPHGSEQLTGDLHGFDNTDAHSFVQIYQLWYQQSLAEDTLRLKVGIMDASCDFSVMEHGLEFLNSTMAYSIAMCTLPTYPDSAPGILAFWQPCEHFSLGAGTFYSNRHDTFLDLAGHPAASRGSSGGMFYIAETAAYWTLADLPGHAGVGGWLHTGTFQTLDGDTDAGTAGCYFFADQTLWSNPNADTVREVGLFLDAGYAVPRLNAITHQVAGGLTVTGLLPDRPDDIAGAGAAWVHIAHLANTAHDSELSLEVFYKCLLTHWASIKADLQYLRQPGGDLDDALAATLRIQIDF